MVKSLAVFLGLSLCVFSQEVPRHLFNQTGPLTDRRAGEPRQIALDFIRSIADGLNLNEADLASVYVAKEYRTEHNGVTHILLRQRFDGVDVLNAGYVVNVSADGEILNAGGDLFKAPAANLSAPDVASARAAVIAAAEEVNPRAAENFQPVQALPYGSSKSLRFAKGAFGDDIGGRSGWFATERGTLPAWEFEITDPDSRRTWSVVVSNGNRKVLARSPLTLYQSAAPKGLVFERGSPQPNPKPGEAMAATPPIVQRTVQPFTGDPVASPKGWVTNNQTAGNNVVAGTNPEGAECVPGLESCQTRPVPVTAPNGDFSFPLELGPNAPTATAFAEAVTTNLFYWMNRTHDFFHRIGFDEAAGSMQEDNFGRGGIGGDAVYAYAQAAIRSPEEAELNNANFGGIRITEDGSRPRMAMYLWTIGGSFLDGSLDADIIVHEYVHGVTFRLIDRLYASGQGGAMGEGWSDFLALEMLTPNGASPDGVYPSGSYVTQIFRQGDRTHPYTTDFELNPLTFASYGRVIFVPEAHADGEIWAQALVEVRSALIKQFGEAEGRRRLRLLMIDSMKLSVPSPSMIDARDAVLLADRVNFNGASQEQIWSAFARRGLGTLAQSYTADSVHVSASFDRPSRAGALKFYNAKYTIGEPVRIVLHDGNLTADRVQVQINTSSGDLENVQLRKRGGAWYGIIGTGYAPAARGDGRLNIVPGDAITAFYTDFDTGAGARQMTHTVPTDPDYSVALLAPNFRFANERPLGLRTGFGSSAFVLPFEFPYYGRNYKSIRIYNNGLITFDQPDFSPCSDIGSLVLIKAIAPMWMSLRTNGRAQQNEDVYVSESEDAVTIRWAAETSGDFEFPGITAQPDPVNFAATLYRNGRIEFRYGTGNKNLVSGSQVLGCPAGSPTVGISPGVETFAQILETHDSKGNLENAPVIRFDPSFVPLGGPQVKLESPVAGDKARGVVTGRGIAYDLEPDVRIRRIDVIVDGIARTVATLSRPRPDFCSENNVLGCPQVGFQFAFDTTALGLAPGSHRLQLRVTNSRGAIVEYPEKALEFTVEPGAASEVFAKIETPEPGAEVAGRIGVTGYFAISGAQVTLLEVLIDGINYGPALYGMNRREVCAELPDSVTGCPRIGFTFNLNSGSLGAGGLLLSNGPHKLQIRALDEFGRFHTYPATPITINVNNEAARAPQVVLTSPRPNQRVSGIMQITGHAWDPDGKVESVRMIIDGVLYSATARITYGSERPEVCATLKADACPKIGFEGEFDTRRLANGLHSLRVIATDDQGRTTQEPAVLTGGIDFFVENPQ